MDVATVVDSRDRYCQIRIHSMELQFISLKKIFEKN